MKSTKFLAVAGLLGVAPCFAADKARYSIFDPAPVDERRAFNTDRSSKTDSPFTIDAGVFQVETDAFSWTVDRAAGTTRTRTMVLGQTNFKVGLTNWMDLQIVPQGYIERITNGSGPGGGVTQSGYGDTTVRLKINLLGNEGGKLVIGFLSSLKIPTNSDHLGNSVYEPGFSVPANVSLPAGFTFFAQIRVDLLDRAGSDHRRVQWSNTVGISRTIVGKLSGYAEFYSAVSSGVGYPWIGTADAGLSYQVAPNCSVDVSLFYGLTDSADDVTAFTGFAFRF
ncbi:MAG: transporter [Chthoniobacterales bacterium]